MRFSLLYAASLLASTVCLLPVAYAQRWSRDAAVAGAVHRYREGYGDGGTRGDDFGKFRLGSTLDYTAANVDAGGLNAGGLVTRGRTKTLSIGVAGYYDIDTGTRLRPFVGGGIDAVRVTEPTPRPGRAVPFPGATGAFAGLPMRVSATR
ncbi:hypothetical protein [Sphingomonas elodea]|uniref:hypothetical protein n=1 Tax=Sphingomonas elodea TaxID=179878 RepID=UPI0002630B50|nr:hypothetical protein [Sphingomonas elodea]